MLCECFLHFLYFSSQHFSSLRIWLRFNFMKQTHKVEGILEKSVRKKAGRKFIEQPIGSFCSFEQRLNIVVSDFFPMTNDFVDHSDRDFVNCKSLLKQL